MVAGTVKINPTGIKPIKKPTSIAGFIFCLAMLVSAAQSIASPAESAFDSKDYDRAFRIWYLELNSNADNPEANFGIGRIVLEGLGAANSDITEGLAYLTRAVEQGSSGAALYLADEYKSGDFLAADQRSELRYLEKARSLGKKGLTARIAKLVRKIDGSLSAKACKTYSKKDRNNSKLVAQCIERGHLEGRATDFYKVAFREGDNSSYLSLARELLNPVSPAYDLEFMSQYLLDFLRKAKNKEKSKLRSLIVENGLTAEKCGISPDRESKISGAQPTSSKRKFGSRSSKEPSQRRSLGSSRSKKENRRTRTFGSKRGDEAVVSGRLNHPMCILAAESGDSAAQVVVSDWFAEGMHGLPIDQSYSEQLLARAAENGGSSAAIVKQLEKLWELGRFAERVEQLSVLRDQDEYYGLVQSALLLEANYLLDLNYRGEEFPELFIEDDVLRLIFETVAVNEIDPRYRIMLSQLDLELGIAAEDNLAQIDLGSPDLEGAYLNLFEDRDVELQAFAEDALYEAAENQECGVLAFLERERRTFGSFADELIQKFGARCSVLTPEDSLEAASSRLEDEDYFGAIAYLEPLLEEGNCAALKLVNANATQSRRLEGLLSDYRGLLEDCGDDPEIAFETLSQKLSSGDKQTLYDEAERLCLEEDFTEACVIASDLLIDKKNNLVQQKPKEGNFGIVTREELRQTAIEELLLDAARSGSASAALRIVEMTLFDRLPGTSRYSKEAKQLVQGLERSGNPNGKVLVAIMGIRIDNPLKIIDSAFKTLTGDMKRQCLELSRLVDENSLATFVGNQANKILSGPACVGSVR